MAPRDDNASSNFMLKEIEVYQGSRDDSEIDNIQSCGDHPFDKSLGKRWRALTNISTNSHRTWLGILLPPYKKSAKGLPDCFRSLRVQVDSHDPPDVVTTKDGRVHDRIIIRKVFIASPRRS